MSEAFYDHKHSLAKLELWSKRIYDCKNSGLKVDEWCQINGVQSKSYWRWHKILKDQYQEYCKQNASIAAPELYEVDLDPTDVISSNVLATVRMGSISADIYTSNAEIISAICSALKSC